MASLKKAELGKLLHGQPPVVWSVPEGLNQTFKEGDFVYRNGGYLVICGADPALILGIALEDAHNTTAGLYNILVGVFTEGALVEMTVYHSTAGNNKIEQTDLGTKYGIDVSANCWRVDKTDASNTRVRVQQFVDEVDEVSGRVLVSVLAANREVA